MTRFEMFLLPEPITFPNRDSVPILPSATSDEDSTLEPPLKLDLCYSKQSLQFSDDEVCCDKQRLVFPSGGYTDCRACYFMKIGRLMKLDYGQSQCRHVRRSAPVLNTDRSGQICSIIYVQPGYMRTRNNKGHQHKGMTGLFQMNMRSD
jgi:hypothetical protein